MIRVCEQCGSKFNRSKGRFCGYPCVHAARRGKPTLMPSGHLKNIQAFEALTLRLEALCQEYGGVWIRALTETRKILERQRKYSPTR